MSRPDLITRLTDKLYRETFVSSTINSTIAYQIRDLRKKHDLGQTELGDIAGMKQTAISRLENPDYGNLSVNTLKRIAKAFDVALVVRFVPYSELARWKLTMTRNDMVPASFDEDEGLRENPQGTFSAKTPLRMAAVAGASNSSPGMRTEAVSTTKQLNIGFDSATTGTTFWRDSTPKKPRERVA